MAKLFLLVALLLNLNTFFVISTSSSPPSEMPYPPPPLTTNLPEPGACPIDALELGACVDVLWGLIHFGIGSGAKYACCPLFDGLVGFDAALCLCSSISLKLLNISIVFPVALEVLVNECGKHPPQGFQCPVLVN